MRCFLFSLHFAAIHPQPLPKGVFLSSIARIGRHDDTVEIGIDCNFLFIEAVVGVAPEKQKARTRRPRYTVKVPRYILISRRLPLLIPGAWLERL
jgi:hypothetical protein